MRRAGTMTRQRLAVLEALRSFSTHPTADELFGAVRRRLPRVSLATVYRNLHALVRAGLATTIEAPGFPRRFDGNISAHAHVRCERCGRVADVRGLEPPRLGDPPRRAAGFSVSGWSVGLVGLCPACSKRGRTR